MAKPHRKALARLNERKREAEKMKGGGYKMPGSLQKGKSFPLGRRKS